MNDERLTPQHMSDRLSRALGRAFVPDEAGNPGTGLMSGPVAQAYAKRLRALNLPAQAQGNTVSVDAGLLREAIRSAGGSDSFFDTLEEDAKASTQANAQPSQPAEPQQKLRDQEKEKLLALAEGLEQDSAAVQFREGLMARIELQQAYEPGFDRAKALVEAGRLIRAVNKGHERAVLGAKKRQETAEARVERKLDERDAPPQVAASHALEQERVRTDMAAERSEAMARALKAFLRGNAPMAQGMPIVAAQVEPMGLAAEERELSGAMMQGGIARALQQLNLREPGLDNGAGAMPMAAMTPQQARAGGLGLAA